MLIIVVGCIPVWSRQLGCCCAYHAHQSVTEQASAFLRYIDHDTFVGREYGKWQCILGIEAVAGNHPAA